MQEKWGHLDLIAFDLKMIANSNAINLLCHFGLDLPSNQPKSTKKAELVRYAGFEK